MSGWYVHKVLAEIFKGVLEGGRNGVQKINTTIFTNHHLFGMVNHNTIMLKEW
jgi:hypothetical protein